MERFWHTSAMLAAATIVLVFAAFGASTGYGFTLLDDPYLIIGNLAAHGPTAAHLWQAFTTFDPELYIPLTLVSYQVNYLMGGLDPSVFHVTNLLLHAANAMCVAWLIALLTKRRDAAIIAGLLFAIHPLHTEAAVWAAGRKDTLSALFYLLSFIFYLRFHETKKRTTYAGSIAFFACGLLSKVMVLTLPVTLLITDVLFLKRRASWSLLVEKIPYFLLSGAFALVATLGKERILAGSGIGETILMAARSTVFYLQKLVWPTDLTVFYPEQDVITILDPQYFVPLVLLVVLAFVVIFFYRRSHLPLYAFAAFLVTLAPTFLNFRKADTVFFAVDRYAYLPSVFFFLLVGLACGAMTDALSRRRASWNMAGYAIPLLLLLLLLPLSRAQTRIWTNDETLFGHALDLYPDSIPARTNLAVLYRETGRLTEEHAVLEEGMRRTPHASYVLALGAIDVREGRIGEGKAAFEKAFAMNPQNPEPLFFLADLEEQLGNIDTAVTHLSGAIAIDPSYTAAYNNLGSIYFYRKDYVRAEDVFRKALAWNPSMLEAHYNLFQILERTDRREEAYGHLLLAHELYPDSVDILFALAYRFDEHGEKEKAAIVAARALELAPNDKSIQRLVDFLKKRGVDVQIPKIEMEPEATPEERREQRRQERMGQ